MSALARTALRLAAVTAFAGDPVLASLCGPRIYDSRIDALSEHEAVPVIVVMTERMEGDAWSANNGGPPFDDHCDLLIEIGYRAVVPADAADENAEPVIGVAENDAELEMTLDLIEQRCVDALNNSALVRCVERRFSKENSERYVDPDSAVKMAQRLVTLTAQLKGDDTPATVLTDPVVTVTPGGDNAGTGTLALATPPTDQLVIAGTYRVTFTAATAFTATDPNGNPVGTGVCGASFANQVRFTISAGGTPFAEGDAFALAVTQGPYAALPDPLRSVCGQMEEGSYGAGLCGQLVAAIGAPAAIQFLTGADLTVAPQTQLTPDQAPIGAGAAGANPDIDVTVDIPG